jgi:hypothetical protein
MENAVVMQCLPDLYPMQRVAAGKGFSIFCLRWHHIGGKRQMLTYSYSCFCTCSSSRTRVLPIFLVIFNEFQAIFSPLAKGKQSANRSPASR